MSIDWFTFTAQIINFLILIWLLKRFLYGPVVRAMTEREEKIASRFRDAEESRSHADARERDYEQKLQELAQTKETMIAGAGQEVKAWRDEHLQQAKADVEDDRRQWQQEIDREKQTLIRDLQRDVARHAVELGHHVLAELADERLLVRIVDRFLDRLGETDRQSLAKTQSSSGDEPLVVASSHELSDGDRERITGALSDFHKDVTFRTNPQLICGIELLARGCRIGWNIRESLAEIESDLIDAVDESLPRVSASSAAGVTT